MKGDDAKWSVRVRCGDVPAMPLNRIGREAGIDRRVTNLVTTGPVEPGTLRPRRSKLGR
ncbi:MAG: hypothetical protein ACYDBN_10590 [Acidimicrobiales bacterium]